MKTVCIRALVSHHNTGALSSFAAPFLLLLVFNPVAATEFETGELRGSWDNTLSYGISGRIQDRDNDLIGIANGGNAFSVNGDDGNLNYDKGVFSNIIKMTSEAEFNYRNYRAFIRGKTFYDFENENKDRDHVDLTHGALEEVGSDIELLDAFLAARFDIGDIPGEVRVGEQVISWGESTFIPNSINTINTVDLSAFRVPGSELKEALVPEGLLWGSLLTSDNTAVEAFYQYDWGQIDLDPPGSYFSTADMLGAGAQRIVAGFGQVPEGDFLSVPRGADELPDDSGQFGAGSRRS